MSFPIVFNLNTPASPGQAGSHSPGFWTGAWGSGVCEEGASSDSDTKQVSVKTPSQRLGVEIKSLKLECASSKCCEEHDPQGHCRTPRPSRSPAAQRKPGQAKPVLPTEIITVLDQFVLQRKLLSEANGVQLTHKARIPTRQFL